MSALSRLPLAVLSQGSPVRSLAVLADGRLASGGTDGTIKLWPKEGTGEPVVLSQGSWVLSLAVLADGRLASGGEDGAIKLWPKEGTREPVVFSQGSPSRRPARYCPPLRRPALRNDTTRSHRSAQSGPISAGQE